MTELLPPLLSIALWFRTLSTGARWAYGSAFIVLIGVIGESIADLTRWINDELLRRWIEKASALILIVGLTGDLVSIRIGQTELEALIEEAGNAKTSAEQAKAAASAATGSAQEAKDKAERANDASGKAKTTALDATTLAGAAHREADSVHRELGKATNQLTQLEVEAKKTESDLINLALCNAPRVISNWFITGPPGTSSVWVGNSFAPSGTVSKSYVDALRPMSGQIVFIEVVPDAEARRAALNIARTLADAKWNVQPLRFVDGLADGVSVQPSAPPLTLSPELSRYWNARDVAGKLLDFLHSYNWQAAQGWPIDPQGKMIRDEKVLPAGAIRIQVGLYPPAVYVSPPGQKDLTSRLEEMRRERERAEAESKRRREEYLAALPPEFRKGIQQREEEWEAKIKSETSMGPCQILNPLF